MNPESGSHIAAAVLPALISGFSTQTPASGFESNNYSAAVQGDVCAGATAGAKGAPVIWS